MPWLATGLLSRWSLNLWSTALDVLRPCHRSPCRHLGAGRFRGHQHVQRSDRQRHVTATMPKTLVIVQDLVDEDEDLPELHLGWTSLTCSYDEIAPHTTVFGARGQDQTHTAGGKVCLTGTVHATDSTTVTKSKCIPQRHSFDTRPGHGLRDRQDRSQPQAQGSGRQRRFAIPVPRLVCPAASSAHAGARLHRGRSSATAMRSRP